MPLPRSQPEPATESRPLSPPAYRCRCPRGRCRCLEPSAFPAASPLPCPLLLYLPPAIPNVLKGLTFAEEALISPIQPVMAANILKFGMRSVSGHVAFVDRCGSVCAVATRGVL